MVRTPCGGDHLSRTSLHVNNVFVFIIILAMCQTTSTYITVSMRQICQQTTWFTLPLSSSGHTSSTSLLLETPTSFPSPKRPCRISVTAPDTHSLSLLFTQRVRTSSEHEEHKGSCNLTISFPLLQVDVEESMSVDLCSNSAKDNIQFTDLLPQQVNLEWSPPSDHNAHILASEIVLTAVGRGREVCNEPGQFPCIRQHRYPIFCVASELACDGKRNCPLAGDDEDPELCQSNVVGDHKIPLQGGTSWEYLASEIIRRISSKQGNNVQVNNTSTSEKPNSSSEPEHDGSDETESIPEALSHYGPWGYLMLGMLICGTVLMICGLWECCCRQPKSSTSNTSGPTLLIINQTLEHEVETPPTPGPPRYEDLDQPPSYTTLYPTYKSADTLPITRAITDNLSSSQQTTSTNTQVEEQTVVVPK